MGSCSHNRMEAVDESCRRLTAILVSVSRLEGALKGLVTLHQSLAPGIYMLVMKPCPTYLHRTLLDTHMACLPVLMPRSALLLTGDANSIADGRNSYPSGHAAYMFCTGTVLSLYLLGKTKVLSASSRVSACKSAEGNEG